LVLKVREAGRVARVHALVATAVNAERYRELLGITVISSEDSAGWWLFFRDLVGRGLSGVHLVTADACPRRAGRSDRGNLARRVLATLPHPLQDKHNGPNVQDILARGSGLVTLSL
jgi:hypothetical protein